MKLKKGDKVIVISGKDKGKVGVIQRAYPKLNKIVVEGVNVRKKHQKPTQQNQSGSIVEMEAPIDASNVMLLDPKKNVPTRVSMVEKEVKGKVVKVRVSKKSGYEFK